MFRIATFLFSIICCFSVLLPVDAEARNIDRFTSGSWYYSAQNGHGFSIEVGANGLVVIYWYAYHPDGTPMFILAVGQADGMSVTATAYYNTGMRFGVFDPSERIETEWGTITITFHGCNSATVEYQSTFVHKGEAFGSGSFPIEKLVTIDQLQCQDNAHAGTYEGRVFSSIDQRDYTAFLLIAPSGEFVAWSEGGLAAFGDIDVGGGFFNAAGTSVSLDPEAPFSGALSAAGEISQEYRLFTVYQVTGGDSGFADFYSSPTLHRRGTTLNRLAGGYSVFNPETGVEGNATVMANGSIVGSDELGCQYDGSISIPDTQFNVFEISLAVSSCPGFNATYTGLGSRIDWFEFHDSAAVRVLVTDGIFGYLLIGVRDDAG